MSVDDGCTDGCDAALVNDDAIILLACLMRKPSTKGGSNYWSLSFVVVGNVISDQ